MAAALPAGHRCHAMGGTGLDRPVAPAAAAPGGGASTTTAAATTAAAINRVQPCALPMMPFDDNEVPVKMLTRSRRPVPSPDRRHLIRSYLYRVQRRPDRF